MSIPHKVADRITKSFPKFRQLLQIAKDCDPPTNEADTVTIIKAMFKEVFGYDRFMDLTSEYAVHGTFCDLAIKVDNKVEYLLEAKAIGTELKENHIRQATDYGANHGIQWVILSNGIDWQLYRIRFEQPIAHELVASFCFPDLSPKNEEHQDMLFLLCKEGVTKDARETYREKVETLNRFMLGALISSDEVLGILRRELKKVTGGKLVDLESLKNVVINEVLKREVIDGEEATKAQSKIHRFYTKILHKGEKETAPTVPSPLPILKADATSHNAE